MVVKVCVYRCTDSVCLINLITFFALEMRFIEIERAHGLCTMPKGILVEMEFASGGGVSTSVSLVKNAERCLIG